MLTGRSLGKLFLPFSTRWMRPPCMQRDIHFLVKAKDGGGYGDPDVKTDDQSIAIDPPATERNPFYHFPTKVMADDVLTLRYENWREQKSSMQNLASDDCYMYAKVTYTDGTFDQIENTFNVGSNPDLQMDYLDNGNFQLRLIPEEFFNVPATKTIDYLEFIAMKKVFRYRSGSRNRGCKCSNRMSVEP